MRRPPIRAPGKCVAALVLALASAQMGCAGAGHGYPCGLDGGSCTLNLPDGGATSPDFMAAPVVVWHDGLSNSATDVVLFNGNLYAGFRHAQSWGPDAAAQIYLARSGNQGATWQKTAALSVAGQDVRQPKLAVFNGSLWVFATAWDTSDPSAHRTTLRAAASLDGQTFSPLAPVTIGQSGGLDLWRPRLLGSQLYLSVWKTDELFPASAPNGLALYATADGKAFAGASTPALGPGARQGELVVRASGDRWLTVPERQDGAGAQQQTFCHAAPSSGNPDWSCWSVAGARVDGPALFEYGSVLYLAGRREVGGGRARTSVWQVLEADKDLSLIADVTSSFGDTGAPGVVALDDSHALLTFHTTSALDPGVTALGHEPTLVEAESQGFASDVFSVVLYMPSAAAGR